MEIFPFELKGYRIIGIKVPYKDNDFEYHLICKRISEAINKKVVWEGCFLTFIEKLDIFVGWRHLFYKFLEYISEFFNKTKVIIRT